MDNVTALADFDTDERQVRKDLAALYRLFFHYGWTDLIDTHLSARFPGRPDEYLINPYGQMFDEITASSLLHMNWDGDVVTGSEKEGSPAAANESGPEGSNGAAVRG